MKRVMQPVMRACLVGNERELLFLGTFLPQATHIGVLKTITFSR